MGIGSRLRKNLNSGVHADGGSRDSDSRISVTTDAQGHIVRHKGTPVAVGSPLLRSLAARVWVDVTKGAGVVLVDGKEVKPAK